MSEEDCEDCINDSIEGLYRRQPNQVNDPYNYLFTSAKNTAFDILRERKLYAPYDPHWLEDDDPSGDLSEVPQLGEPDWTSDGMIIIAEAALEVELTARNEQLRAIFHATLPNLPSRRRRLVEVLLEHGATVPNAVLADIMNQSETAIKSLKSRAFGDLRRLLPDTADELGIDFDSLVAPEPEVLALYSDIPSEDQGS